MYYIDNNSGSPNMPPLSPAQSNIPTWFTEGDKNKGISWIGQDWLNILQAELLNILSEAGIKPDKGKLNQLTLSIKTIITANAYTQANNLKEIFDAGVAAQAAARGHLGLGKLATKDSLGPSDVNALAKDKNLADLQSVPLALANLTLANVKKYVESTNTGVSKLPKFRPSSEDDLTSLPAGYMALAKNETPGGPLPDENWFYLEVAGNLNNESNNPNRKGAVIRLIQVSTPEISWTGVKFDDGTTTTAKFKWSRDFNTLNKPTPEDVGLAATKKAIDDTQTGLAAQGVMWVTSADDLSNLPSGAHRFACNKAPATVLPAAGYFFLEVLSKRDVANGSCILATSDAGNVWIGLRYTAPTDTAFTWIQLNQNVENLGLTDTVNRALHVNGDGDIRGSLWGEWLSHWLYGQFATRDNNINARATVDWVRQNFLSGFRLGAVESAVVWRAYGYGDNPPYVITGVINGNTDDLIDNVTRRPLQMYINGWRNVDWL